MTTLPIAQAWAQGRGKARRRSAVAAPFLLTIVTWFASVLPTWKRFRTAVMQITAFGFIDYAVFQWNHLWGFVAIGVSLFVLEALGGERK